MILPGVTRDSVLNLARDHASGKSPLKGMPEGKFVVNERSVTMKEVKAAAEKGQLVEFFGTGTSSCNTFLTQRLTMTVHQEPLLSSAL